MGDRTLSHIGAVADGGQAVAGGGGHSTAVRACLTVVDSLGRDYPPPHLQPPPPPPAMDPGPSGVAAAGDAPGLGAAEQEHPSISAHPVVLLGVRRSTLGEHPKIIAGTAQRAHTRCTPGSLIAIIQDKCLPMDIKNSANAQIILRNI